MVDRRLRIVALILAAASISGGWITAGFAADVVAPLAVQPRPTELDAPLDQILGGTRALVILVYGQSAFLAALGTPHNRVNDEAATPLFAHMYSGGYLGMAHLLRLRRQDKDSPSPGALRGRQEMLIGDPFLDARYPNQPSCD